MAKNKDQVSLTINKEVMQKVRDFAEKHNRNLSNMVEFLLKEAMKGGRK